MISNYLTILAESLQKKAAVLDKMEAENKLQEQMLKEETFSYDEFDAAVERKGKLIEELTALDEGFDSLYQKIREELLHNKDAYKEQITELKSLVTLVTEKSVRLQTQEARNKQLVERTFSKEKKELRFGRKNSGAAYSYYKNMSKGNVVMPQFMDKKK